MIKRIIIINAEVEKKRVLTRLCVHGCACVSLTSKRTGKE